jgi:DNA-binding PadR family transcriptional regulator
MLPFQRFKNTITNGNIWIYVLALAKENPLPKRKTESLIFEKFGFLPGKIITQVVLRKLENGGYLKSKKFHGEKSYVITNKGIKELGEMKEFSQSLIRKI